MDFNRIKLAWYEHVIMRYWFCKDQASYEVACDIEASDKFGIKLSKIEVLLYRNIYCYLRGFIKGMIRKEIPDSYIENWFK